MKARQISKYRETVGKAWTGIYVLDLPGPFFLLAYDSGLALRERCCHRRPPMSGSSVITRCSLTLGAPSPLPLQGGLPHPITYKGMVLEPLSFPFG